MCRCMPARAHEEQEKQLMMELITLGDTSAFHNAEALQFCSNLLRMVVPFLSARFDQVGIKPSILCSVKIFTAYNSLIQCQARLANIFTRLARSTTTTTRSQDGPASMN